MPNWNTTKNMLLRNSKNYKNQWLWNNRLHENLPINWPDLSEIKKNNQLFDTLSTQPTNQLSDKSSYQLINQETSDKVTNDWVTDWLNTQMTN